eukprot:4026851-Alexandrium_andersonii.AAC.1
MDSRIAGQKGWGGERILNCRRPILPSIACAEEYIENTRLVVGPQEAGAQGGGDQSVGAHRATP